MKIRTAAAAVALAAVVAAPAAGGTITRFDRSGTVLLNGVDVFPIVLSKGPPREGTTPTGANALDEVVSAGVTFLKTGPATTPWTDAEIDDAKLWNQAAAARGVYTWPNLSTLAQAQVGTPKATLLQKVITSLKGDPQGSSGIGMWKGADEPWWGGIPASSLRFAYCLSTSRGDPAWCAGQPPLDSDHLWVTIQAPVGTAQDLQPYSAVTDTHGVDKYPIGITIPDPDLHQVGVWTNTMTSITPSKSVWTTLQICSSGSYNAAGDFVLPTRLQERYMIYDAIINGARSLGFYGGNNFHCYNASDTARDWNWTFWNGVLKGLIQEIGPLSPLSPALRNADTNRVMTVSDSTTQAIGRMGATADDTWVLAARYGAGGGPVTISGLPAGITTGTVYTEGRSIPVSGGSFTDTFSRWAVHVYHFRPAPPAAAPTIGSFSPTSGAVGVTVTITGTNLDGATAVRFNGASASFSGVSGTQVQATVPAGASSGPISVTTPGGTATSTASFTVTSPPTAVGAARLTARRSGASVVVRWRTAQEVGLLGFRLLRVRGGRSVRLNRAPIAARGGTGAAYRFVDRSAQRVPSLYYRLVALRLDGRRAWTVSVRAAGP